MVIRRNGGSGPRSVASVRPPPSRPGWQLRALVQGGALLLVAPVAYGQTDTSAPEGATEASPAPPSAAPAPETEPTTVPSAPPPEAAGPSSASDVPATIGSDPERSPLPGAATSAAAEQPPSANIPPPEPGAGPAAPPESERDAELEAFLDTSDVDEYARPETLRIYGFFDFGLRKVFYSDDNFLKSVQGDASTFVIGNLNLFFDAQPSDDWRGLLELRFTNSPHGQDRTLAVPGGQPYSRVDRQVYDDTSPNGRNQILIGSTVIERAWAQYTASDAFSLRVGSWFTPYGIWNIDHGTPTLISLLLPDSQVTQAFPLRQTGVQALGSFYPGSTEFGYHATISNGRTYTQFDLTNDKALGGRLFVRARREDLAYQVGASGYWGTYTDQVKTVASFDPFVVDVDETIAAEEWGVGLDLSMDVDAFRLRSEGILHRLTFEEGKRAPTNNQPGTFVPDQYYWNAYVIAAYRLPFAGLEPYGWFEVTHRPSAFANTTLLPSVGLNIYFSPEAQLKSQVGHFLFYDAEGPYDAGPLTTVTSRLVLSF